MLNWLLHRKVEDHEDVDRQLASHERRLSEQAKRLRRLEIEVGIYKPPLKGDSNSSVA